MVGRPCNQSPGFWFCGKTPGDRFCQPQALMRICKNAILWLPIAQDLMMVALQALAPCELHDDCLVLQVSLRQCQACQAEGFL